MAFLSASIFAATSFPSRASLISFASAGVPLSKWTTRVHDFSISDLQFSQSRSDLANSKSHTQFGKEEEEDADLWDLSRKKEHTKAISLLNFSF